MTEYLYGQILNRDNDKIEHKINKDLPEVFMGLSCIYEALGK